MKTGIHPILNHVVFVDSGSGAEFPTLSTLKSDKTKKINGVDHFVIVVDISSATHPFYTGKHTFVDTAGRVDKFRARMEAAKKKQDAALEARQKKGKAMNETAEEKITRKAKENTEKKEEAKKEESKKKADAKKATAKKAVTKKEESKSEGKEK